MSQRWIRHNKITAAIIIYIILFASINMVKPAFLYKPDGNLRVFGLGYRSKTIIPVWLLSIFLAIISYFSIMYYTTIVR
jgi:hypothetical protein